MFDHLDQHDNVLTHVMRMPRLVDLEITSRCNLRCSYCYYFDNPAVPYRDLPAEAWLHFLDELGQSHVMEVCIAGGEPFMRKDLPHLIEGIIRNHMRYSILSNGSLITDRMAAFLANTHRCNQVQISIDGSNPEPHDAARGTGTFERAVQGIRVLQKHEVPVAVRVTIHRHNVHDLEDIATFLLDDLGLPGFSTNTAGYLGSCRSRASELMLTAQERELAMEVLLKLSSKTHGRISATAGPLAEARMWKRMLEAREVEAPAFPNGGYLTGCGCPTSKISVRADGTMVPCMMLPHLELGRINQDSLLEVWQESPVLNQLRMRHTIPLNDYPFCQGCEFLHYCTGNCPALAYSMTGKVNHPSPDACLRRFLKEGGSVKHLDHLLV
jgi:SynChlorMet cassette radical SAM/SPASM protein ScmE